MRSRRSKLRHQDWDQLRVAASDDRVLVSNDWDFVQRHRDWMRRQEPHCGVVIVPIQDEVQAFKVLVRFLESTAAEDVFSEIRVLS